MFWIITGLAGLAAAAAYLIIPGGRLWRQYVEEVEHSMAALTDDGGSRSLFTKEAVSGLPDLLKSHIINGGYMGTPLMSHMMIHFRDAEFAVSVGKNMIPIRFMQVNFVKRPDRHAFLSGRMAGLPLQAKDSVIDGAGSMTGVIAKRIPLFCSAGSEMDQSQLITALADAVFMPALFLQEYVTWTAVDSRTVEGKITWKNVSAKGRFIFDEKGRIVRFDTSDRYMDENGKGSSLAPWSVVYSDYRKKNGFVQPGSVRVSWDLPEGEHTYFVSGEIETQYCVRNIK